MIMMIVAMTKHLKNGYFANWSGKKAGEGIEFLCFTPERRWPFC